MLLSICVPTYNRAFLLKRQLNFLLSDAKSYLLEGSVELLVSSNASSDETDDVVRQIKESKEPFAYYTQDTNIGALRNMKFLVNKAKGEYVWIVGDDDFIKPGTTKRIIEILEKYKDNSLGAIFMGSVWLGTDTENVDWDGLNRANSCSGEAQLLSYSIDASYGVLYNPLGKIYWDLMFITGAVRDRAASLAVLTSPLYEDNYCTPLACSLLCMLNRSFVFDDRFSVRGGVIASWSDVENRVGSVDMFLAIYNLRFLGYPEAQISRMLDVFLKEHTRVRVFSPFALLKGATTLKLMSEFYSLLRVTGKRTIYVRYTCIRGLMRVQRDILRCLKFFKRAN